MIQPSDGDHPDEAAAQLRAEMEAISERCYAAAWAHGLEFRLWAAVLEATARPCGATTLLDLDQIDLLRRLAAAADAWWHRPDGHGEATRIPLPHWMQIYVRWVTSPASPSG